MTRQLNTGGFFIFGAQSSLMTSAVSIPCREGWFASNRPRANLCAAAAGLRANPDGVAMGRFGWVDAAAEFVANAQDADTQRLGFVLAIAARWTGSYILDGTRYIRPGLPVTLMSRGDFWCRFPYGAIQGDVVYADATDGTARSGVTSGAVATPWRVVSFAAPGELAIISTWSTPNV